MKRDLQNSLIETVQILAGERLKNVNFTKSFTGLVKSIDIKSLRCIVEIDGHDSECIVPHNLLNYIWKDDIVIIQDIANNNAQKIVQGVIPAYDGSQNMFHIYDDVEDRIVSSIEQLWDEELQQEIFVQFEMGE